MATKWFRGQSESQRRYWVLAATDPKEASKQMWTARYAVRDYATQLGVNLSPAQTLWLGTIMAQDGLTDPRDPSIRNQILRTAQAKNPAPGAIRSAREDLRHLAKAQFLKNPTKGGLIHWGNLVATGQKTLDDYRSSQMWEAAKRFPHMKDLLDQGLTPGEIVAEHRNLVAQELELTPEKLDVVNNATWRQLTGVKDPKSGKMRLPTFNEVIRMARARPEWWKTTNGRQTDASMASGMLGLFGQRPDLMKTS
jgi:hypothetical protein